MNKRFSPFALLLLLLPSLVYAQQKDTLTKKLDSLSKNTDSAGGKQKNDIREATYNENTKITVHSYLVLTVDDIKQQITSPFKATGSDWLKVGAFGLTTAGFVLFLDKPINRLAVRIRNNNPSIVSVSSYVTGFGGYYEAYTLAAFGAYGYLFKNEKTKTTTFLATQAYLTAGLIETALKYMTGRQRPLYYDPVTNANKSTFHGPLYQFTKQNGVKPPSNTYTSFPSGHTTVAFAAATVFAMEYKNSKFVPVIAYSAATLIGLSRLTENAHWASDVLVGAVLGFLCGRQVVNNYHRYSKIKSEAAKKKNTISFNLNYSNGTLMPGFVYKFR
ncbi:MAG TPA: phosphatase PAP2 family protein [Puia sp.]|nr:phosphatase PAP2 family protein [Puia sp.]